MLRWLRGIGVPPVVVGAARGVLEAAVFAIVPLILDWAGAADSPEWARAALPLAVFAWRLLEGYADQIDPDKVRR